MSQSDDNSYGGSRPSNFVEVGHDSPAPDERSTVGGYPVAPLRHRFLAIAFDFLISLSASAFIIGILYLPQPGSHLDDYIRDETFRSRAIVALAICYIIFPIIANWLFKGTAGKRLLHLQVVDRNGRHAGLLWIVIRHAVQIPSAAILPVAIAWIAFDRNAQGWHDKLARTYVTYAGAGRINDRRTSKLPRSTADGQRRGGGPLE